MTQRVTVRVPLRCSSLEVLASAEGGSFLAHL